MMAASIRNILSKNKWTGRDVGLALLSKLVHETNQEKSPLTDADIHRMQSTLVGRSLEEYYEYQAICNSLVHASTAAEGIYQQFFNGYYRYYLFIEEIQRAEEYKRDEKQRPQIMTQEQYESHVKEKAEELSSNTDTYAGVILSAVEKYTEDNDEGRKVPQKVKAALNAAKKEKATNKRVLYSMYERGRFVLPDGTTSEDIDAWTDAMLKPFNGDKLQRSLAYCRTLYNGEEGVAELYKRNTGRELPKEKRAEAYELFDKMTWRIHRWPDPVCLNEQGELMAGLFPEMGGVKFEDVTEIDESTTKYDVLDEATEHYARVGDYFAEFVQDYPSLYTAVKAEVEKLFPKAKGVKVKDHEKENFATWAELARAKVARYADLIKPSEFDIGNIAVYQGEHYTPPAGKNIKGSLEYLMHHERDMDGMRYAVKSLLIPAIRYVYAFNAFIEALSLAYNAPLLKELFMDTDHAEKKVDALNGLIYTLVADAEDEEQRDFIRQNFRPIDMDTLRPVEEEMEEVKQRFIEKRGTQDAIPLIRQYGQIILDMMGGIDEWNG